MDGARRALASGGLRLGAPALDRVSVASAAGTACVLATVAFADGGLLPRTWRLATVALLGFAAAALLSRETIRLDGLERLFLALLGSVAGWTALSAAWSPAPSVSLLQAERVLVYAAAALAALLVFRTRAVAAIVVAALGAITLVAAYGLLRYLVAPPPYDQFEERLLYQPLGYANALGLFTAVGIVVSVGLFASAVRPVRRAWALAPLLVLAPALYYTSSRGAWIALAAGLAALSGLRGRARTQWTIAAAAVVLVVVGLTAHELRPLGGERPRYWDVALADYRSHPLLGSGAGTYGSYWLGHRPDPSFTRTAHSLYLQTLAEQGPVGLLLLVGALALPLVVLRRPTGPLAAIAAGGYVVYLVHTGIDWDWELPGATLPGLLCGALLLVCGRADRERAATLTPRARRVLVACLLGVLLVETLRLAAGPRLPYGQA